ncbi:MAG: hypothetical protein EXS31_02535 [Pedosphaera sp.]|nr:hypothetical protein [Pedosphaera sp.]
MNLTDQQLLRYSKTNIPDLYHLELVPEWSVFGGLTFKSAKNRCSFLSPNRNQMVNKFFSELTTRLGITRLGYWWRLESSSKGDIHNHFVIAHVPQWTPEEICNHCRNVAKPIGIFVKVEPFNNESKDEEGVRLGLRYVTKITVRNPELEKPYYSRQLTLDLKKGKK